MHQEIYRASLKQGRNKEDEQEENSSLYKGAFSDWRQPWVFPANATPLGRKGGPENTKHFQFQAKSKSCSQGIQELLIPGLHCQEAVSKSSGDLPEMLLSPASS